MDEDVYDFVELAEVAEDYLREFIVEHDPPHHEQLPIVIQIGRTICVRGKTLKSCSRFSINFICGFDIKSNVALHFNPRLDLNYVVRNSRINGKWGEEETTAYRRPNVRWNDDFLIEFLPTPTEFMIAINKKHFCKYTYRLPITQITALVINGKIQVVDVFFEVKVSYPNLNREPVVEIPLIELEQDGSKQRHNIEEMSLPFCGKLTENITENYQLVIEGRVKLLPRSFFINIQEGCYLWPHPTIHFHFNPRFQGSTDKNLIIKNSWYDDQWGPEERTFSFPFIAGKEFRLTIYVEDNQKFCVWFNNYLISEYQVRTSTFTIDHVYIEGDVFISDVRLEPLRINLLAQKSVSTSKKRWSLRRASNHPSLLPAI